MDLPVPLMSPGDRWRVPLAPAEIVSNKSAR